MKREDLIELTNVLTVDDPLGPSNAEELIDSPSAARLLFDRQNEIYSRLAKSSGIIIGRRGSGKTAFLNQLRLTNEPSVVQFAAPNVFPEIVRSVSEMFGRGNAFVEVTSSLWEILVWSSIFPILLARNDDARVQTIRNYANRLGFGENTSPDMVMTRTLDRLRKQANGSDDVYTTRLRIEGGLAIGESSYVAALSAAKELIASRYKDQTPILVLMDTLESYHLDREEASLAIKGLIRFLGRSNSFRRHLSVRFALPAELYEVFRRESENPDKDFSNATMLNWRAGDLWSVAAHRLFINLEVFDPRRRDKLEAAYDINDRKGAMNMFSRLLPEYITNRLERQEPTLAYVLRHTQLLPRHLLHILNKIFGMAVNADGTIGAVRNDMIVTGVANCEQNICDGIEAAYRHKYPHFRSICVAALPQLPKHFNEGLLHEIFNKHVMGVEKRLREEGDSLEMDFPLFRKMLIETGVVGKKIDETEIFSEALYEYSRPGSLVTSVDDSFCVHPLFSSLFPRPHEEGVRAKLVYPYGIDPAPGASLLN